MADINLRIGVSGVSEATSNLSTLQTKVQEVSESVGKGIDPFRSGKDLSTFSKNIQEQQAQIKEQGRRELQSVGQAKSQAIAEIEKAFQEDVQKIQAQIAQKSRGADQSQIKELKAEETSLISQAKEDKTSKLGKADEFFDEKTKTVTEEVNRELEDMSDILQDVRKIFEEIASGEKGQSEAPKGTRDIGILEKQSLELAGKSKNVQEATSRLGLVSAMSKKEAQQDKAPDQATRGLLTVGEKRAVDTVGGGAIRGVQTVGGAIGGSVGAVANFGASLASSAGRILESAADVVYNPLKMVSALADAGISAMTQYAGMVIPRGMELAQAQDQIRNTTGMVAGSDFSNLGYNLAETQQQVLTSQKSLGDAEMGMKDSYMLSSLALGTGMGDASGFSGLNQSFKYFADANSSSMSVEIGKLISLFDKSALVDLSAGDFTRMAEGVQMTETLNTMQQGRFQDVDMVRSGQLIAGLELIGGTFKGQAGMQKLQGIDRSITDPQNDYQQAVLFRALMEDNPNMSYIDLLEKQQEGVFGEGNVDLFMKQIEKISGGGEVDNDMFLMNVADTMFQGNIKNARQFIESRRMVDGEMAYDVFDRTEADESDASRVLGGSTALGGVNAFTAEIKSLDTFLQVEGIAMSEITMQFIDHTKRFIQSPMQYLVDEATKIQNQVTSVADDLFGTPEKTMATIGTAANNVSDFADGIADATIGAGVEYLTGSENAGQIVSEFAQYASPFSAYKIASNAYNYFMGENEGTTATSGNTNGNPNSGNNQNQQSNPTNIRLDGNPTNFNNGNNGVHTRGSEPTNFQLKTTYEILPIPQN